MRRAIVLAGLAGLIAVLAAPGDSAHASWNGSGSGSATTGAKSMPAGNQPTASVSGSNITVSWAASSFSGGAAVAGYAVKRYSSGGALQTIGANCSGTISALTCTENAVPTGSWRYSVTPTQSNWLGAESPQSSAVNVTVTVSTSAWNVGDASAGVEIAQSSPYAFGADLLTKTSGAFATSFSTSRYLQWDYNAPLQSGLTVSGANFNFSFAESNGGQTACFYFDVRRISTGAVLATHGSSGSPITCTSTSTLQAIATALPEVTSSDIANDLRVRVYVKESGSSTVKVDQATVTGTAGSMAFTLYDMTDTDAASGTPATTPWSLAAASDSAAFTSLMAWPTATSSTKYLKLTFPAYAPSGVTLNSVTFTHAYRPATSGSTACYWFEVYAGTTLIATHGSNASPTSCNASSTAYVTDNVALPEINTVAEANTAVVKLYVKDSASHKTMHDLASLAITYTP